MKSIRRILRYLYVGTLLSFSSVVCAQDNNHAALAIDRSDGFIYGWSYDQTSSMNADKKALKECVDKGGSCEIALRHAGPGCIAYRTVPNPVGTAYGWAASTNRTRASVRANAECKKRSNGLSCSNQVWACNSGRAQIKTKTTLDTNEKKQTDAKSVNAKPSNRAVLFVVDKSGSMRGAKMNDAKASAISAAYKALDRSVKVGVLAFSGDCNGSNIITLPFTLDRNKVSSFVNGLTAEGGTPLSPALISAGEMMAQAGISQEVGVTVVLADGDDNCGGVAAAVSTMRSQNYLNRHETVGLEVDEDAADDLRYVANQSGGNYQNSTKSADLEAALIKAVNASVLLDLIGSFNVKPDGQPPSSRSDPTTNLREKIRERKTEKHWFYVRKGQGGNYDGLSFYYSQIFQCSQAVTTPGAFNKSNAIGPFPSYVDASRARDNELAQARASGNKTLQRNAQCNTKWD